MVDLARALRRHQRERRARRDTMDVIADLVATNADLDDRVARSAAELQTALERAEAADQMKSTFVHGMAHELSTPLHAIHGLVELVESRSADPEIRDAAHQAARAASRLNQALRTLLDFAAFSAGDVQVDPAPIVLGDYADRVLERWRLPAARAGLLVVTEVLPDPATLVSVDEGRLDQIVDALVDNAIRFGRTNVRIRFERAAGPASRLHVRVSDSGPGIPVDDRTRVFGAFERGDVAVEGFGLGLTLARSIATLLGGRLELETPTGGGTTVHAELPAGDPGGR